LTALVQKHAVLTAIALLLSLLTLAWVQPNTSAGAGLLILTTIIIVNAIGVVVMWRPSLTNKRPKPKRKSKPRKVG
jgi:hypothetical protein